MKNKKKLVPIKKYTSEEALKIANELINWLLEKEENMHIDEFLYINKKVFKNDVDFLIANNEEFEQLIEQAEAIELTKLKKYASGDRLNASIVKQILINKYNWI